MPTLVLFRTAMVPVLAIAVFALGGAARAAGNTVAISAAGDGNAAVSGYTISSITYNPNGVDFHDLDSVTFTATADNGSLAGSLNLIQARFEAAGSWYACTRTGGVAPAHNISCNTTAPQLTVLAINTFTVVIVE